MMMVHNPHTIRLAFVPLTDAAPLIVARELGFFEKHDLHVKLSREASWASVRDKLQTRMIEGAQMLASMPLSLALGMSHAPVDVVTGLVLSQNGNAITVSLNLFEDMKRTGLLEQGDPAASARALKVLIEKRRELGKNRLCFASVYRTSPHHLALRYWMKSGGIDPDRDVRFVVIAPPRMVESLESGLVDGFCVGEPWNHRAVHEGAGHLLLTSFELWGTAPEKVLAVRRDWLERNGARHAALCRALVESCAWIDQAGNREKTARILAQPEYLDVPEEIIRHSLLGQVRNADPRDSREVPDFHVFHRNHANRPKAEDARWFIEQMVLGGHLSADVDPATAGTRIWQVDAAADALNW